MSPGEYLEHHLVCSEVSAVAVLCFSAAAGGVRNSLLQNGGERKLNIGLLRLENRGDRDRGVQRP